MDFPLQPLIIPSGCRISKNDFTTYNPEIDFTEERNLYNLTEDLLQIAFDYSNLLIDLGWYGEISTNDGEFYIHVIENENWDNPIRTEKSKSQKTITEKLELLLLEIRESGKIKPVPNKVLW
ncbi:hypothetical protein DFQ10_102499 [Winogradskyella eximia]|uniref:Uncharacterized protein n=1 Tax=Winogradskyella eximia TaxID=262006 RepID=A0A3D9H802_9FLAO|nr:hypothetical protein [Winogradskyella eximia]RED45623.1 hypothetical protein DFQ10_102499 [Winogradskyella eximia]